MKKSIFTISLALVCIAASNVLTVEAHDMINQAEYEYTELQGVKELINSTTSSYEKNSQKADLKEPMTLIIQLNSEPFSAEEIQQDTSIKDTLNSVIYKKNEEYKAEKARKEAEARAAQAKKSVEQSSDRLGSAGRLYIPDVGVSVALYYGADQGIVDAWDSAAYFSFGAQDVIGDHNNQGFNAMKSAGIGTKAYIKTSNGTKTYVCVANIQGHNTGYDLTTSDGTSLSDLNAGGIAMYTCNEHWTNVTITFWQPQ